MAETTQLELVTPARVMLSKSVEMVVIPGSEGLFGVLAHSRVVGVVDLLSALAGWWWMLKDLILTCHVSLN